ncbi:hypothetical protein Efla_001304 [Eimeria flavescens]
MASDTVALGGAATDASVPVGVPVKEEMSRGERLLVGFGCALVGLMSLLPFQFVVVMLPVLCDHFLDGKQLGNSMLGLHQAVCVLALLVILRIGALQKWMIQGGVLLALGCMAAFGPAFFYGSFTSRLVLLHIIMGLVGCCNAMLQAAGFARAAILPENLVGVTSIGQAVAGLVVFVFTSILMNCVYDMDREEDVSVADALSGAAAAAASSRKQLQAETPTHGGELRDMEKAGGSHGAPQEEEALLPPRPWLAMIRGSVWELTSVFLVFFVSFNIFPKVGPVMLNFANKSPAKTVWLFGMHFVGDFLGRSSLKLPNLHKAFGFVFLSSKATTIASFLRLLFYIPFFLAAKLEDTAFINSFAWLLIIQLLLAFTLGWVATLALIHCSLSVTRVSEKARMGSLSTITLALAIGVGLYIALAF